MLAISILLKPAVRVVTDWKKEFPIFSTSPICCIVLNCSNKKNVIAPIIIRILVVVKTNLECKDNLLNFLQLIKSITTKCPIPPNTMSIEIMIMTIGSLEKSIKLFLKRANPALLKADTDVNKLLIILCLYQILV